MQPLSLSFRLIDLLHSGAYPTVLGQVSALRRKSVGESAIPAAGACGGSEFQFRCEARVRGLR